MTVQVIVLTGSMGAGKTTVLGEASDLLTARGVVHAVIDLDALSAVGLSGSLCTTLTYDNLAAVWSNFATAGVTRLLLAEAVESADELHGIRSAIPGSTVVVCRLIATSRPCSAGSARASPGCCSKHSSHALASSTRFSNERAWKTSAWRMTTAQLATLPQKY